MFFFSVILFSNLLRNGFINRRFFSFYMNLKQIIDSILIITVL